MFSKKIGAFIFRFRGQLPIVFLGISFISACCFPFPIFSKNNSIIHYTIVGSLIFLGVLYRIWVVTTKAQHTSGRNRHEQVAESLNTNGPYSISQHPLYFANFLIWMGVAFFANQYVFLILIFCFSTWMLAHIIREERSFLEQKFENIYKNWAALTPVFIPNPFKFNYAPLRMDLLRIISHEYPSWVSIIAAILSIQWIFNATFFSPLEIILIICGIIIGLGGRFLKYFVLRKWLNKQV